MSTTKSLFACLLALTMLVSAAFCLPGSAFAAEIQPVTMETSDIDNQLVFLKGQIGSLKQNDGQNTWYYAVTDLDHDGLLEFIAASQHPQDRSTNLRVWEIGSDRNSLTECSLAKDPDESFPDILTDVADTFHDTATDTWNYLFYDNVIISPTNVFTSKSAYRLKDGVISYEAYAVEHTVVTAGGRNVSHTDANGISISADQYNAAGVNAFAGAERGSTNFEWLTAAEADSLARLIDSISVFMGQKAPTESFPVPRPEALQTPAATELPAAPAAPAATPAPAPAQPVYLSVTKNPTNENRTQGETALFVSCANAYESLSWTLVAPSGGEYSVQNFRSVFGNANVTGEYSTTLSIANVSTDMDGWGAYCTFYYKGQTARTTTAYVYVTAKQSAAPSGNYSGYVTDWNYSSVTVNVANTVTVTIPRSICDIEGELNIGASASVYWDGKNVTWCYIKGIGHDPQPYYGSMGGTAYESGGGFTVYLSNGDSVYVDGWKCNVSGQFYDGASCVAYYTDYPNANNIYSVDIYGSERYVGPVYGDMNGNAYEGGGGFAINLTNGESVYVDGWKCSVYGNFYDGAMCTVHYQNYPSSDNITSVEIYGSDEPVYDEPQYTYGDNYIYELHEAYNPDGSTYNTVTCPNCFSEVSMAYDICPNCGFHIWG